MRVDKKMPASSGHSVEIVNLHIRIVGPIATLGCDPSDVLSRILNVTRFTVNTVLEVYNELWLTIFFDDLISPGRALALRRLVKHR